jgi:hypothetical protein
MLLAVLLKVLQLQGLRRPIEQSAKLEQLMQL